ncbi:hypothetical protein BGZ99_002022 [Dissophora globulifera]|uniref:Uncharacterized protein n=1 Tax=Dissophora globulifera TaxID=979702 RepID=A0A9P6QYK7_9FUNG|nr:hypothetical protein BGZ99_002022 [Dissophora globulifera]
MNQFRANFSSSSQPNSDGMRLTPYQTTDISPNYNSRTVNPDNFKVPLPARLQVQTALSTSPPKDTQPHTSVSSSSTQSTLPSSLQSSASSNLFPGSSSGSSPSSSSQAESSSQPFPLSPSLRNKTKQKGHAFTQQQEEYIARLLSVPETWKLLNSAGEKNSYHKPKTEVRAEIALKVCQKFSTGEKELTLNSGQIKNKIESMKKVWKKANAIFQKTGNSDLPTTTLETRVLKACHFYFILAGVWSASQSLNPGESIQLTDNLTHGESDLGADSSEESDGRVTVVAVSDNNEAWQDTSSNVKRLVSLSPTLLMKRRRNDFPAYTDVLEDVVMSTQEKCQSEQHRHELDVRKDQREDRRMQLQTEHLELKLEIERKSTELELQKINNQTREEAKRAMVALILLEVELAKAKKQLQEINTVPQATGIALQNEAQAEQQSDEYEKAHEKSPAK